MVAYDAQTWFTAVIGDSLLCYATRPLGFDVVDVSYSIDSRISALRGSRGGRGAKSQEAAEHSAALCI